VVARSDATFLLPEVAMGLVPGAGGTASIPRRIGRHRSAHLALAGRPIDAVTALEWGLVDRIDDAAFPRLHPGAPVR
jgi:enoyl-CoA hydratase/carnithine racemase